MRKKIYVPMIALCLLLTACGSASGEDLAAQLRQPYADMTGCEMVAEVSCPQENLEWQAQLRCLYVPGGESSVEVLRPEEIAGVKAVLNDTDWRLEYQGTCLNAGAMSRENISPAACLPRLMSALRDGWLLEQNQEDWGEVPCLRICVDQTGLQEGKILSILWLRLDDGTPLRGEISVDGEIILTAEFTEFSFCDTINQTQS